MELNAADLKLSRFEPLVDTQFVVSTELGAAVPIEVSMTMSELRTRPAPPSYQQYAMLFVGPLDPLLPQGMYRFRHEQLGELSLFMVPVGRDSSGSQYEVCVARSTAQD